MKKLIVQNSQKLIVQFVQELLVQKLIALKEVRST